MTRRSLTAPSVLAGLLVAALISSLPCAASAQEAEGAAPQAAPPLFHGVGYSITGELSESPVLAFGWNVDAVLFALGAGLKYDANGLNPMMPNPDKFSFTLFASISYMAYNKYPFAAGPELNYVTTLAPNDPFTTFSQLQPGLAMWYAPFHAPLLLGTALQLHATFTKGAKAVVETVYPGVRVIWAFP